MKKRVEEGERLGEVLARLLAGEIDGDEFVRSTSRFWHWLANDLERRIDYPRWLVEHDDVYNDLVVEAYHRAFSWDSSRGVPLSSYVVFAAEAAVKKRLHKARGANQHDRSGSASTIPTPFSAFEAAEEGVTGEQWLEAHATAASCGPAQEESVDKGRRVASFLASGSTRRARLALQAFVELGSIAAAAAALQAEGALTEGKEGPELDEAEAAGFVAGVVCRGARRLAEVFDRPTAA